MNEILDIVHDMVKWLFKVEAMVEVTMQPLAAL
jgi:hypothetical protein